MAIAAPADDPNDGDGLFAGRYRLIAILKRGGMGVTYRAWDTRLRMPVVIKMPNESSRSDGAAMQRFAREIEAMLLLEHDHIVPIGNHGNEDGCPFVVMPYLPGGSLADMRRRDKNGSVQPQLPGTLPLWLPSVASALDFIHGRGLLHRDVKPGNIFFDGFWNAFLGDFGIAKVVDDSGSVPKGETLTATMAAIGTPEYMAPELFRPKAVPDSRSDQYGLAVTVYEMLAGQKPFTGSVAHIVIEHCTMPVPPLASRTQGLPASLCAAVEKALAKWPEDRFKTCGEFATAALRDVLPSQREPNMARLLCPSCSTILRMPTSAGGKVGKCPNCKAEMRIAKDLSALWLGGEEDGNRAALSGQQFQTVVFEPAAGEPQPLIDDPAASPPIKAILPRRQLAWIIAPMLAAVALSMIAGLLSHMRWKAQHERQVAALIAEQTARSQAAEGEWQKKVAAAEERIAVVTLAKREADEQIKELRDDVKQLEAMVAENEARVAEVRVGEEVAMESEDEEMAAEPSAETEEVNGHQNPMHDAVAGSQSAPGTEILTAEVFHDLAQRHGRGGGANSVNIELDLKRYSTFSSEAVALLRIGYSQLAIVGTTSLSDDQAEVLGKTKGTLNLDCVTMLTDKQAASLARHEGILYLNGLTTISDVQAENFAKRSGSARKPSRLSLNGLATLSDQQARSLAKHSGYLYLDGVAALTDKQAADLGMHAGCLSLDGLTTLSDAQAESLAMHKSTSKKIPGMLSLDGLRSISDRQAQALALSKGQLHLNGLTSLTDAQAEALAMREGLLGLDGLTSLTDRQADAFAAHTGTLHLDGLTELTDRHADALAKHRRGNVTLTRNKLTMSEQAWVRLRANGLVIFH
jgi:serine/threonine protein kinase